MRNLYELKITLLTLCFVLTNLVLNAQTPDVNGIVYVKPNGNGNGFNWNNATSDLQGAINAAGVSKVFVAVGNYPSPTNGFVMKNNVVIYGGFDPANGITTLTHHRILPTASIGGSVLNGENARRVIYNYNGSDLNSTAVLDGFTITNGYAQNTNGGGIYNFWSSPSFNNLVIKENVAGGGAGVSNLYSNAIFTNIEIINNTAQDASGGGMSNNNGSPILTNVTFSNNTAYLYGGAMQNGYGCSPILTNVKMVNNTANSGGGAIGVERAGGTTTLINVTIANNSSPSINILEGSIDIKNSIVYGGIFGANSFQYSLVEGYSSTADGNISSTNVSLSDIFTNPSNADYSLKPGSPAINVGNNTLYAGLNSSSPDLAGNLRSMGSAIDLGVYESFDMTAVNGIIYVKPTATGNGIGSSWENATDDLHQAIHATGVQKVFVAKGNYNVGASSFVMKNGVEIYGGFDPDNNIKTLNDSRIMPEVSNTNGSILNGENTRPVIWNVFTSSTTMDNTAVLDGFTIMNGKNNNGGGIRNVYASPIFRNLVIRDNNATGNNGGGIYNESSNPLIINSIIYNNYVSTVPAYGGAMFNNNSTPTVINCNIVNNRINGTPAFPGYSAGITGNSIIYNSILWGNRSDRGMIGDVSGSTLVVKNSITEQYNTGNSADNNQVGVNPMFVGATDFRLQANSPAINTGSNTYYVGLDINSKDLSGNNRVFNYANGGIIDVGALESPYTRIIPTDNMVYVRTQSYGKLDGSSWEDATNLLQDAINGNGVQKVFVATGNYNVGANSFVMKNGVEIYGGFNPDNNIRTLNDNRIMPDASNNALGSVLNGQNARPVIWNFNNNLNATAILDGFNIANGNYTNGGGIVNTGSSPTYRNLVIRNNKASVAGGGMYNFGANPSIINTVFKNNSVISTSGTTVSGGAMYNDNTSAPILTNVNIIANTVSSSGTEKGGGIYNNNSNPKIYNSILWNNIKQYAGSGVSGSDIENTGGAMVLKNSITQGYTTGNDTDNNLININPNFVDVSSGNYRLQLSSPAIGTGNNSFYSGLNASTKDLDGKLRLSGDVIDIGAYEYQLNITPTAGIVYVKPTSSGTGDGSSWANATKFLQDAINTTGVQKVYVATGNYNVGNSSFVMKNGVEIYGGFNPVGNVTDWNTRTLPNKGMGDGSVLNGKNERPVIWNVFTSSTVMDNSAVLDGFTIMNGKYVGNSGGGIRNVYASPTLQNLVIRNNEAGIAGGGIYNNSSSSINLSNSVIKDNTAQYGGGIYNNNSASKLTNVSITGNSATLTTPGGDGGGIFNENAAMQLINVLIANNTTVFNGAGFRNLSGNPVFTNVTIVNNINSLTTTDAIQIVGGNPQINNSIIYGVVSGSYTAQNSLIENYSGGTNGNLDGTSITADVVFNNSLTGDYTLKNLSPAINAGDNLLNSTIIDLAENTRIYNISNSGIIDLGAYESIYTPLVPTAGIIYVKETATGIEDGSSWENATSDLHKSIHTNDVQKVFVATGNYNVGANSFIMKNGVEIYGGFDPDNNIKTLNDNRILPNKGMGDGSVLNGQNSKPVIFNVFDVASIMDNTAVLDGFTIKNGKFNDGGGIRNVYASPTLRNLVIKNNQADYGAGIFNKNSSSTMTNVEITDNVANRDGGGMYNDATSSPNITNMKLTGNTANNANGGGMYNRNNSSPMLINTLITDNTATGNGGAIRNETNSSPQLINVTIANNGGVNALYATDGTTTIDNSIVLGTVSATYTAQYSLIEGNTDFTNGNIDPTGITAGDIFTNNANGDYALSETSPVINQGNNTLFASLTINTEDLAGNTRVYDFENGGIIDLGAYEFALISPLPIILTSFTGNCSENGIQLSWTTATENNVNHYEIYRSRDGKIWGNVAEAIAVGNSSTVNHYTVTDERGIETMYYKLRSVDNDGAYEEFNPISVKCADENENWSLYPVPAINQVVITIHSMSSINENIVLLDMSGRIVKICPIDLVMGRNEIYLDIQNLTAGTYILKMNDSKESKTLKLVKTDD